ncbi:MAG: cupin domain-containing protein [Acidobacteria bacterium]|nr:cupin domain-containing protein [Acidobacteriota bacterium]
MATESPMIISNTAATSVDERIKIIATAQLKPVDYDWGSIKWICDRKTTPESVQSFGYAFVLPNQTNPEHRHLTCEEIIYMLAGELKIYAHDECITLRPGQTALIPKGVRHKVVNEGWEPVVYIASFSAAFRDTVFKGTTGRLDEIEKLY